MSHQLWRFAMKRLRPIVVVVALILIASAGLNGQEKKDTKIKGTLPPNWGKLGLTDEQKQKGNKVQAEYGEKIAELEAKIMDLKGKQKGDMEKVLSDEQKKRLKDILTGKAPDDKKE